MTEILNPILSHRQEVRDKIIKGFEADIIEKAPLIKKPFVWRISHLSGKPYKDYNYEDKDGIKVEGKDKMIKNGLIISQNVKENHTLLTYTNEMRIELKNKLKSIGCTFPDNSTWYRSRKDDKSSYYLTFNKGGMTYEIRISDHTSGAPDNSVIYEWNYRLDPVKHGKKRLLEETWMLDASLGRLQPKDVVASVKRMSALWSKYNSNKGFQELKKYAIKKGFNKFSSSEIPVKASFLAQDFINDNELEDDSVMTTYRALAVIGESVLTDIIKSQNKPKKV